MKPIIIGVAGGTGSGKTTVASRILERVGAEHITYIAHDAYYRDLGHLPERLRAEVNFETGRVVATAEGDRVSEGFLEGHVDNETGDTNGTGAVNAFGLTGIEFTFEGEYSQDGSVAEGTWRTVSGSEMNGDGTWRIERVEDGTVDISENSE